MLFFLILFSRFFSDVALVPVDVKVRLSVFWGVSATPNLLIGRVVLGAPVKFRVYSQDA